MKRTSLASDYYYNENLRDPTQPSQLTDNSVDLNLTRFSVHRAEISRLKMQADAAGKVLPSPAEMLELGADIEPESEDEDPSGLVDLTGKELAAAAVSVANSVTQYGTARDYRVKTTVGRRQVGGRRSLVSTSPAAVVQRQAKARQAAADQREKDMRYEMKYGKRDAD